MQDLKKPDNITIEWVINPRPGERNTVLSDVVKRLPWHEGGRLSVWAACEFTSMRALRSYFREDRGLGKDDLYISSYWKLGMNEDTHKVIKSEDAKKAA